jgi:hypothetical protein
MFHRTIAALASLVLLAACNKAEKTAPPLVESGKLSALIKTADKIVVFSGPAENETALFTSVNPTDIAEFNDALTVDVPDSKFFCNCFGTLGVRLYRGKTELVRITNHHGVSVRCSLWHSDAMLKDPLKWAMWFDARKMPGPRADVEEMNARAKQREITNARLKAATPQSLRPLVEQVEHGEASKSIELLRSALAGEFPDAEQRILVLLGWYGSGGGSWSGSSIYEIIARDLLDEVTTSDLVAALDVEGPSPAQLEGAARLVVRWQFTSRRRGDLKALPLAVKSKLLSHALQSENKEKREDAKRAFE